MKDFKEFLKIGSIVVGSILLLCGVIYFGIWLLQDPFNLVADEPVQPAWEDENKQCLKDKSDIIHERYAQCVKDAGGNNVRCELSARRITC